MFLIKRTAGDIADRVEYRFRLWEPQQLLVPDADNYVAFADGLVPNVGGVLTDAFRMDYNHPDALESVKTNPDRVVNGEEAYYRWIARSVGMTTSIRDRVSAMMRRALTDRDGDFFDVDSVQGRALCAVLLELANRRNIDFGAADKVDALKKQAGLTQADSLFVEPTAIRLKFIDGRTRSRIMNVLADVLEPTEHRPTEQHYHGFTNGLAVTDDELELLAAIEARSDLDLEWNVVCDHPELGLNLVRVDTTRAAVIAMMRSFGSFKTLHR